MTLLVCCHYPFPSFLCGALNYAYSIVSFFKYNLRQRSCCTHYLFPSSLPCLQVLVTLDMVKFLQGMWMSWDLR